MFANAPREGRYLLVQNELSLEEAIKERHLLREKKSRA